MIGLTKGHEENLNKTLHKATGGEIRSNFKTGGNVQKRSGGGSILNAKAHAASANNDFGIRRKTGGATKKSCKAKSYNIGGRTISENDLNHLHNQYLAMGGQARLGHGFGDWIKKAYHTVKDGISRAWDAAPGIFSTVHDITNAANKVGDVIGGGVRDKIHGFTDKVHDASGQAQSQYNKINRVKNTIQDAVDQSRKRREEENQPRLGRIPTRAEGGSMADTSHPLYPQFLAEGGEARYPHGFGDWIQKAYKKVKDIGPGIVNGLHTISGFTNKIPVIGGISDAIHSGTGAIKKYTGWAEGGAPGQEEMENGNPYYDASEQQYNAADRDYAQAAQDYDKAEDIYKGADEDYAQSYARPNAGY